MKVQKTRLLIETIKIQLLIYSNFIIHPVRNISLVTRGFHPGEILPCNGQTLRIRRPHGKKHLPKRHWFAVFKSISQECSLRRRTMRQKQRDRALQVILFSPEALWQLASSRGLA
ncbi:hypothetical protein [Rhizobium sp. L1K21]|uniref:hypothetical protein n=1 Tax=Rhizobium sp. L1K21 TaxID=2954933 RepID=UPI0020937CA7|nr:hypothetical protein [Rhizobium sp. L1K21]MCO6186590.1 hypothetical protein [Rhizobium sp. L1K21]